MPQQSNSTAQSTDQPIITSQNDQRNYRTLTLDNQLSVILVSDPKADKAAAAMNVAIGSGQDPKEFAGLAHFLEHMLFLGTEKYPEAGEYQSFISKHGGSHNAFTSYKDTNYFFEVDNHYLEPTLDRFAQFFIAPLFTEEYVQREKNA
ncbi:MAG: insulinase family protein, partial [Oceanospirillum sp.]|nr:insulinase family protein [Oceanospirillum sp.]